MLVLVADDNIDLLESLAVLLECCGHEVIRAHDGEAALKAAEQAHPQVAILDIGMPGLSGYEVAQRIRSDVWGHKILLIAHTAWGEEADKEKAFEAGFDRHCTKPVDFQTLSRLLEEPQNGARPCL